VTWRALAMCIALYWLRIFAIGAGYHRFFSHRAYATSRVFTWVRGAKSSGRLLALPLVADFEISTLNNWSPDLEAVSVRFTD
jgi:hypothetical protein